MTPCKKILLLALIVLSGTSTASAQQTEQETKLPISVITYADNGRRMGHIFFMHMRERFRASPDFRLAKLEPHLLLRIHTTSSNLDQPTYYTCVLTLRHTAERESYIESWLSWCPVRESEQCSHQIFDTLQEHVTEFMERMPDKDSEEQDRL